MPTSGAGDLRCCRQATALTTSAPKKPAKNTGFWITSLMFCMTSMKVRSSLRASAGITEVVYAYQTPATRPFVTTAAPRTIRALRLSAWVSALFCVM